MKRGSPKVECGKDTATDAQRVATLQRAGTYSGGNDVGDNVQGMVMGESLKIEFANKDLVNAPRARPHRGWQRPARLEAPLMSLLNSDTPHPRTDPRNARNRICGRAHCRRAARASAVATS